MTDNVGLCCCFSYWNKREEKSAEIETNGREISTRCQREGFIFIPLLSFTQRANSLCHQKGPIGLWVPCRALEAHWPRHSMTNTSFHPLHLVTSWEMRWHVHELPWWWGTEKRHWEAALSAYPCMPARHLHCTGKMRWNLSSAASAV